MSYNPTQREKGIIFWRAWWKSPGKQSIADVKWGRSRTVVPNQPQQVYGVKLLLAEMVNAPVIPDVSATMTLNSTLLRGKRTSFNVGRWFYSHSVGMSPTVWKWKTRSTEIDYGFNQKTLDISHRAFTVYWPAMLKLDAINEWGSVVSTYIAAQRVLPITTKWLMPKHCLRASPAALHHHATAPRKRTRFQSP